MTPEQEALVGLAAEIFAGRTSNEQLAAVERSEDRWDAELWRELADAGLLGIAVPEEHGGAGLGLLEVCLLLEQQGRFLAPVPLWETLSAALLLDGPAAKEWLPRVAAGEVRLSVSAALDGSDGLVTGPFDAVVAVAGSSVVLATGVESAPVETTTHALAYDIVSADSRPLDVTVVHVQDVVRVALSAVQLGVADAGVREAAQHLTGREQFGRPLATFQATQQQLGDAYCDVQAMRATLGQAVFTMARRDVDVATWWATDAGERIQHAVQHLHGGLGADITYPVHRRLLWTMRTNALLGGPSRQLVRLGAALV
ncbi:MAG: putative acyl-CoA dehydrogenase [Frankiales bacterium]|nr:putative acyl-CoA dehydrogenase [Frankiales bacterium]